VYYAGTDNGVVASTGPSDSAFGFALADSSAGYGRMLDT